MVDANNQVQAFYTKTPDVSGNTPVSATPQMSKGLKAKPKHLLAMFGVFLFVIVGVAGILVAQRQRLISGPVSPNAPESRPKADFTQNTCTLYFNVPFVSPSPSPSPIAGAATCQQKSAFALNGQEILPETPLRYGQRFNYRVFVSSNGTTTGPVTVLDELPDAVHFVENAGNSPEWVADGNTVIADLGVLNSQTEQVKILQFMVEVISEEKAIVEGIDINDIRNLATVITIDRNAPTQDVRSECSVSHFLPASSPSPSPSSTPRVSPTPSPTPTPRVTPSPTPGVTPTPSPTPTPGVTPTPSPTPTPGVTPTPTPIVYTCGSPCDTDEQCQTGSASHFCSQEAKNTCRLYSNPSNKDCQPQANSYACNSYCSDDAECQTVNPNYSCHNNACRLASNNEASNCLPIAYVPPAPTVGCGDLCQTNADCSEPQHVCYTTADGTNRCRHQDYLNSSTCNPPPAAVTTYIASAPSQQVQQVQPELPAELPKTGAFELANWIKAGLITLGLGAALLLLL